MTIKVIEGRSGADGQSPGQVTVLVKDDSYAICAVMLTPSGGYEVHDIEATLDSLTLLHDTITKALAAVRN